MSKVFELVRKTASRVYRQRKYEADELHQLQEQQINQKYSSACYNLYQVYYYITYLHVPQWHSYSLFFRFRLQELFCEFLKRFTKFVRVLVILILTLLCHFRVVFMCFQNDSLWLYRSLATFSKVHNLMQQSTFWTDQRTVSIVNLYNWANDVPIWNVFFIL